MAHFIHGLIGTQAEIMLAIQHLKLSPTSKIRLPQNFDLVFLKNELIEAIETSFDRGGLVENSWYLSHGILDFMQFICKERIAYIETEYDGGPGTQCAALVEKNKPFVFLYELEQPPSPYYGGHDGYYPEALLDCPINTVLRKLGVNRDPQMDEFDTMELHKYRTM
jgi:hypothetical protein